MSKTVALVGHCGPDTSYLRLTVSKALPGAKVVSVDDDADLKRLLDQGDGLFLVNRQLDYGFDQSEGIELIRKVKQAYPNASLMLVSNYPEAQQEAVAAGARPGFGKRELGTPKVAGLLKEAMDEVGMKVE